MKKTMAFITALAAVLSLSACSPTPQTSSEESSREETVSTAPTTALQTENSDTSPRESSETEISEAEPVEPKSSTDYWDLLCEEYDRTYDTTKHIAYMADGKLFGKILYISESDIIRGDGSKTIEYFCFDTATKQFESLVLDETSSSNIVYTISPDFIYNGKIYDVFENYDTDKTHVRCYDPDGNVIMQSEAEIPGTDITNFQLFVSEDGSVVLFRKNIFSGGKYDIRVLPPDLSKITKLDSKYKYRGMNNNSIIIEDSENGNCYSYDLKTGDTKEIDEAFDFFYRDSSDEAFNFFYDSSIIQSVGKYWLTEEGVIDAESGEKISELDVRTNGHMLGHSLLKFIVNNDGKTEVYRYILPEDWSEFADSVESYAKQFGTLVYTSKLSLKEEPQYLTEDYIIISDETGYYLVNLPTGEETQFVLRFR